MSPWAVHLTALDAPAEVRAAFAAQLAAEPARRHAFLLSTCHRVELYGFGPRPASLAPASTGADAVRRLLRVAAGLESASLGEDEVLHQVRSAHAEGGQGLDDPRLRRLVETAIATGRRARAGGRARSRSLEARAVRWLAARSPLRRVLVVGAGHMGRGLAVEAAALGAEVTIGTRRPSASQLDLVTAAERAPEFDGVLVALAGRWPVPAGALPTTADLSAPAALPEAARLALGPRFLGIDELFSIRDEDPDYVERAAALVEEATGEYLAWLGGRQAVTA